MNRRNFLKSIIVVAGTATLAPTALVTKPLIGTIDFSIEESIGLVVYNPITLNSMVDAFLAIQRQALSPAVMLMHPLAYKEWNPEGYQRLVELQGAAC